MTISFPKLAAIHKKIFVARPNLMKDFLLYEMLNMRKLVDVGMEIPEANVADLCRKIDSYRGEFSASGPFRETHDIVFFCDTKTMMDLYSDKTLRGDLLTELERALNLERPMFLHSMGLLLCLIDYVVTDKAHRARLLAAAESSFERAVITRMEWLADKGIIPAWQVRQAKNKPEKPIAILGPDQTAFFNRMLKMQNEIVLEAQSVINTEFSAARRAAVYRNDISDTPKSFPWTHTDWHKNKLEAMLAANADLTLTQVKGILINSCRVAQKEWEAYCRSKKTYAKSAGNQDYVAEYLVLNTYWSSNGSSLTFYEVTVPLERMANVYYGTKKVRIKPSGVHMEYDVEFYL